MVSTQWSKKCQKSRFLEEGSLLEKKNHPGNKFEHLQCRSLNIRSIYPPFSSLALPWHGAGTFRGFKTTHFGAAVRIRDYCAPHVNPDLDWARRRLDLDALPWLLYTVQIRDGDRRVRRAEKKPTARQPIVVGGVPLLYVE